VKVNGGGVKEKEKPGFRLKGDLLGKGGLYPQTGEGDGQLPNQHAQAPGGELWPEREIQGGWFIVLKGPKRKRKKPCQENTSWELRKEAWSVKAGDRH